MPKVSVASVTSISMSHAGELLAVGGTAGVQVFHFDGANPVAKFTGLLDDAEIDEMSWDNDDHLYAIEPVGWKVCSCLRLLRPVTARLRDHRTRSRTRRTSAVLAK